MYRINCWRTNSGIKDKKVKNFFLYLLMIFLTSESHRQFPHHLRWVFLPHILMPELQSVILVPQCLRHTIIFCLVWDQCWLTWYPLNDQGWATGAPHGSQCATEEVKNVQIYTSTPLLCLLWHVMVWPLPYLSMEQVFPFTQTFPPSLTKQAVQVVCTCGRESKCNIVDWSSGEQSG